MAKQSENAPKCLHCGCLGVLKTGSQVYPHRPDLRQQAVYVCPRCPSSRVGCHGTSTRPLGSMVNAETRAARMKAHASLDPIWKSGLMARTRVYQEISRRLKMTRTKCHIGMMTVQQCQKLIRVADDLHLELRLRNGR